VSLSPLYTPQEVADLWKVTRRTVYGWIKSGRLKACKIGDTVRIAENRIDGLHSADHAGHNARGEGEAQAENDAPVGTESPLSSKVAPESGM